MRGVSQGELARLTGATQREVSYYERGRSFPRPERLDRLAAALRVDVSDLFLHPDRPLPSEISEAVGLIEEAAKRDPSFPSRALKVLMALLAE